MTMSILALVLPTLVMAAPVPKAPRKPDVEVKLDAKNQLELKILIQNNGKETLEIPYRVSLFEHMVIHLRGDKGAEYVIRYNSERAAKAIPGTFTVPHGQTKSVSLHTCHYLPELGEPGQTVTFTARLKHNGKIIESKPLTVEP